MDMRDAGTSKHGAIRSNSAVMLPSGDALDGAAELVEEGICVEKLRSQNFRRTTGLRAAHRSVWPPTRPNIVDAEARGWKPQICNTRSSRRIATAGEDFNTFLSSAAQCRNIQTEQTYPIR